MSAAAGGCVGGGGGAGWTSVGIDGAERRSWATVQSTCLRSAAGFARALRCRSLASAEVGGRLGCRRGGGRGKKAVNWEVGAGRRREGRRPVVGRSHWTLGIVCCRVPDPCRPWCEAADGRYGRGQVVPANVTGLGRRVGQCLRGLCHLCHHPRRLCPLCHHLRRAHASRVLVGGGGPGRPSCPRQIWESCRRSWW